MEFNASVMNNQGEIKVTGGDGGWPFRRELTVDPTDPDAEYTTIASAAAAAAAGDCIRVGAGTHTANAVDIPSGVDLRGSGKGVTIIKTVAATECLNFQGSNYVSDISVVSTYATVSQTYAVRIEGADVVLERVLADVTNGDGSCYAFLAESTTCYLKQCEGYATALATAHAVLTFGGNVEMYIEGGMYDGDDIDIACNTAGDLVVLNYPMLVNGTLTYFGTVDGFWMKADGNIRSGDANDIGSSIDEQMVGNVYLTPGADILEGYNDRSGQVGPLFARRNRWAKVGLNLLGHMEALPSGHAWAGAPFDGAPTVNYYSKSYAAIASADADGAFMYDVVSGTKLGKIVQCRVSIYYDSEIGLRIDDGTNNNFIEYLLYEQGAYYVSKRIKYQTGGGGITTVNYAGNIFPNEMTDFWLETQDMGGGNWRGRHRTVQEFGLSSYETSFPTVSWTISRVGLIMRTLSGGSSRTGYCDYLASNFTY